MYQSGLVAVIKVGGKVLREDRGEVCIPFGSEYSILEKNLKVQRVKIRITIDGDDAFDGTEIVIPAHSEVELERFIRNGNFSSGNRFKFIERIADIEEFRGVKVDDGLIRIEYWTEKVHNPYVLVNNAWKHEFGTSYSNPWRSGFHNFDSLDSGQVKSRGITGSSSDPFLNSCHTMNYSSDVNARGIEISACNVTRSFTPPKNENGITVGGGQSNQRFATVEWFETEPQSEVLLLHLVGKISTTKIETPITVDMKKQCPTCGKMGLGRFCSRCSTALNWI